MKIAISSTGPDPDAQVDLRFGRCQYFVLVDDKETMKITLLISPCYAKRPVSRLNNWIPMKRLRSNRRYQKKSLPPMLFRMHLSIRSSCPF